MPVSAVCHVSARGSTNSRVKCIKFEVVRVVSMNATTELNKNSELKQVVNVNYLALAVDNSKQLARTSTWRVGLM